MTTEIRALYTRLPAIDRLLRDPAFSSLLAQHGHSQVVTQLRQMLDEAREQIRQCQTLPDWSHDWLHACEQRLTAGQRSALRPVFNLTGTVLHTNLGRAIQAEAAVEAVAQRYAFASDPRVRSRRRRTRTSRSALMQLSKAALRERKMPVSRWPTMRRRCY
ncbi:hypothetical protein MJ524_27455 [Escherichia coli]|nr:hypothetical protein MJ524_27455 [Escherichia coli]